MAADGLSAVGAAHDENRAAGQARRSVDPTMRTLMVCFKYLSSVEGGDMEAKAKAVLTGDGDEQTRMLSRAMLNYGLGKNAEALSDIERASALNPRCIITLQMRSKIRERLGDIEGAERDLDVMLEQCPDTVKGIVARATFRSRHAKVPLALADCNEALLLDPTCQAALELRASVLRNLGLSDASQTDDRHALKRRQMFQQRVLIRKVQRQSLQQQQERRQRRRAESVSESDSESVFGPVGV